MTRNDIVESAFMYKAFCGAPNGQSYHHIVFTLAQICSHWESCPPLDCWLFYSLMGFRCRENEWQYKLNVNCFLHLHFHRFSSHPNGQVLEEEKGTSEKSALGGKMRRK